MKRLPSHVAQFAFDATNQLNTLSRSSSLLVRIPAKVAYKIARPFARKLMAGHLVEARLYGQRLRMPAEHQIGLILTAHPQYNRPLALAATALAASTESRPLAVVDVGANIGETIAVIEQRNPGLCRYLCIEADEELAALCRLNHEGSSCVQTEQRFIGENEGALVRLEDDGKANPSTKLVTDHAGASGHRLARLDTIAAPFAEASGSLDLIKVDTEGYDFSVLRSGSALLRRYKPGVYFEWYPALLEGLGENVWDGFDYLSTFGYESFVFFSSIGDYYCKLSKPDHFLLQSLARAASQNPSLVYFDVFGSTSETTCNELIKLSLSSDPQGRR